MAYTAKALNTMSGGDNVGVDRIGGRDYQIVKICVGGEGTATEISAVTGLPISANTLPLPTGAATSALQTTGNTSLSSIVSNTLTTASNTTTIETNTDFGTVVGGGTETGALRVTLANNSTGLLSVDDNGGSLTVDDGGTTLSIDDGGGSITVDTGVPATGNTELAKAEDVASAAGDVGIMAVTIRDDTLAANAGVSADGDFTYLRVDNFGALWTQKRADTGHYQSVGTLTAVKTAAGAVKTINCQNVNASAAYLQIFNALTGSITLGTTPPTHQFIIPGNTAGAGFSVNLGDGIDFSAAISVAVTTTAGGSTLITSGEVMTNIGYQ